MSPVSKANVNPLRQFWAGEEKEAPVNDLDLISIDFGRFGAVGKKFTWRTSGDMDGIKDSLVYTVDYSGGDSSTRLGYLATR